MTRPTTSRTARALRRASAVTVAAAVVAAPALLAAPASAATTAPDTAIGHWVGQAPGVTLSLDAADTAKTTPVLPLWLGFGQSGRPNSIAPTSTNPDGSKVFSARTATPGAFGFDGEAFDKPATSVYPDPATSAYAYGGQMAEAYCVELVTPLPWDPNMSFNPVSWSSARAASGPGSLGRAAWIAVNAGSVGTPIGIDPAAGLTMDEDARAAEKAAVQLAVWVVADGLDLSKMPTPADGPAFVAYDAIHARADALVAASAGKNLATPAVPTAWTVSGTPNVSGATTTVTVSVTNGDGVGVGGVAVSVQAPTGAVFDVTTAADGTATTPEFATPAGPADVAMTASGSAVVPAGTLVDPSTDSTTFQQMVIANDVTVPVTASGAVTVAPPGTPPTTAPDPTAPPTTVSRVADPKLPYTGGLISPLGAAGALVGLGAAGLIARRARRAR